jgi:DNA mismatch repair protein MutS
MFEQYWKIRDQIDPATLLFYRMGDFYELFGEDAVKAASVLEVQLTARNKDAEIPVPMCGVPAHAVDSYAEKLLSRKFKVALCEQLTDPEESKAKLVERGIVRILTPGLPVDPSKLDSKSAHYFLSLHVSNAKTKTCEIEVLVLDFLGGELFSGVLSSTPELDELLLKIDPKEILLSQNLLTRPTPELARSFLFDQAREYFSRITPWAAGEKASASGNLKEYLHYTQRAKNSALASELPEPQSLSKIFGAQSADFAQISHAVLTQWNVLPELFELLDGCGSALGSRALQNILSRPLASVSRIRVRQNFWEKALPDESEILSLSRNVYDLERILGRFRVGVAAPKELLELFQSLVGVMAVLNRLDHSSSDVRAFYDAEELENFQQLSKRVEPLMELMSRMLETSGEKLQSSLLADLIRSGFDETLDGLRSLHSGAEEWLRNLEDRLRAETDIPSLKVRYNRVFGYFVEVTKTHLAKVPSYFERKQTTVSGERFTLPELRAKES